MILENRERRSMNELRHSFSIVNSTQYEKIKHVLKTIYKAVQYNYNVTVAVLH